MRFGFFYLSSYSPHHWTAHKWLVCLIAVKFQTSINMAAALEEEYQRRWQLNRNFHFIIFWDTEFRRDTKVQIWGSLLETDRFSCMSLVLQMKQWLSKKKKRKKWRLKIFVSFTWLRNVTGFWYKSLIFLGQYGKNRLVCQHYERIIVVKFISFAAILSSL